jgi:uncharacterized protein YbjT (DUF2867 family)
MKVAVAGGTGVAGGWTVTALRDSGHDPVVLARSAGVDLVSGEGLAAALRGADAVVDATNVGTANGRAAAAFFEAATRNLMRAAAEAGVRHIVALSIIGIDLIPLGYYKGKVRQEQVLAGSSVPVSVLRAAQFHEFPGQYLSRTKSRLVVVPRWAMQPVAAREVGAALAGIAVGPPAAMTEIAGPRRELMADLMRQVAAASGDRRRVVQVRLPGKAGRALAGGGGLPAGPGLRGTQTFADWLAGQRAGTAGER